MDLVRTWTGQIARAAGASLIAPLVLLLAAGVVAASGGLASFASLGEVASGPELPDVGLSRTPGAALQDAEIVGADLSPPADVSSPPSPGPDELASAAPPVSESPGHGSTVVPPQAPPRNPRVESFELREPPSPPAGGDRPATEPPASPAPQAPVPVDELIDATRGLGDTLGEPLRPITDAILELLGGPPRR